MIDNCDSLDHHVEQIRRCKKFPRIKGAGSPLLG